MKDHLYFIKSKMKTGINDSITHTALNENAFMAINYLYSQESREVYY